MRSQCVVLSLTVFHLQVITFSIELLCLSLNKRQKGPSSLNKKFPYFRGNRTQKGAQAERLFLIDVCGRKGVKLTDKTRRPMVNKQQSRQGDYYYLNMLLHLAVSFLPRTTATTQVKAGLSILIAMSSVQLPCLATKKQIQKKVFYSICPWRDYCYRSYISPDFLVILTRHCHDLFI